jgi:hypothetical protein
MNHINIEFLNMLWEREDGRTNISDGEILNTMTWNLDS